MTFMLKDDAGTLIEAQPSAASGDPGAAELSLRLIWDQTTAIKRSTSLLAWTFIFVGVMMAASMIGFMPRLVMTGLLLGIAALVWAAARAAMTLRRNRADIRRRVLLAEGRCPACWYVIKRLGDEGCLVKCPECSARWARTDIYQGDSATDLHELQLNDLPPVMRDARGIPRRLADLHRAGSNDAELAPLVREARTLTRGVRLRANLFIAFFFLLSAACAGFAIFATPNRTWMTWAWTGVPIYIAIVLAPKVISSTTRGRYVADASPTAQLLADAGRCPACLGVLDGQTDATGVTVCSRCGAAWKCNRSRAPAVESGERARDQGATGSP